MNLRLRSFSLIAALALLLAAAPSASAHANLLRSEPAASSAQPTSPTRVRAWFSEDLEASFSSLSVTNSSGAVVDKGDSRRLPDDTKGLEVSLPELPQGLYTVVWKALSADDGHATSGSFSFAVGDVPIAESSPREVIAQVETALSASAPPGGEQVFARTFNILALVLLGGSFAFPLLILYPALKRAPESLSASALESGRAAWAGRWARWLLISIVLVALASIAILLAQSLVAGGLSAVGRVLTSTRFGTLWLLRVGVLLALALLVASSFRGWSQRGPRGRSFYLAAALVAALLVIQSLNSHAAAVSNPPFVSVPVDLIHMAGTAVWIGSLFQLVFTLPALTRQLTAVPQSRLLSLIIARFSVVMLVTVNLILLSGAWSLYVQVGSLEAFFQTVYGESLLMKFALLVLLLAVAAFNLIVVRPGLVAANAQRAIGLVRGFRRATLLEVALGCLVLLVVGLMTSVSPARSAYNPNPRLLLQTRQVDDVNITLGIAPGLVGPNDFDIKVTDLSGKPIDGAEVVRLLGTMRDMEMGTQEVTAVAQGGGHYTLRGDLLSMVGNWDVEVLVRRPGLADNRTTFAMVALDKTSPPSAPDFALALREPAILLGLGMTLLGFALGAGVVLLGRVERTPRLATQGAALLVGLLGLLIVLRTPVSGLQGTVLPGGNLFVPQSARFIRSPIPPSPDQIAAGAKNFQTSCVVCHGPGGKGNGPLAATLNPRPVDLTIHGALHTEGEVYYYITNGVPGTAMPKWEDQYTDLERWQLVQFVRNLALQALTPTPGPTRAP